VLRDATARLAALGIAALNLEASLQDRAGRTLRADNLPKRETLVVASGRSADMRAQAKRPAGSSAAGRFVSLRAEGGGRPRDQVVTAIG